jgi:hypothetical protein
VSFNETFVDNNGSLNLELIKKPNIKPITMPIIIPGKSNECFFTISPISYY